MRALILSALILCSLHADDHEPEPGTEIVHPVDKAIMVYVPAGPFIMGMDADAAQKLAQSLGYKHYHKIAAEEWFPKRTEITKGYFIDKYEVTVERWSRYAITQNVKPNTKHPKIIAGKSTLLHPIVRIHWDEARQFANWAGKSLPTEKQWEKAARGTDGRIYPWGNGPLKENLGVFVDLKTRKATQFQIVGSKPDGASPYGCLDMAGNVYEWTSEWHEPYQNNPEYKRIIGYMGHKNGCLRGGSFYHGPHSYSCAKRFGFEPDVTYFHVGFRTVWEPPAGYLKSDAFRAAREAVGKRKQELKALRKHLKPVK